MKVIITSILIAISINAIAQDLKSSIQEKIWKLNEGYTEFMLIGDTLYIYFASNNYFRSGITAAEVANPPSTYNSSNVALPMPPRQATYAIEEQKIIIYDNGEDYLFNIIYYDNDDLILQNEETIIISGGDNSPSNFSILNELRFILQSKK